MISVYKRRAVVTGGARGIGLAIAERLLSEDCSVCLWDISPNVIKVAQMLRDQGHDVIAYVVDVTDENGVEAAARYIGQYWSDISILINNAGVNGPVKSTVEYTTSEWRRVVEVNLLSVFLCSKLLIPMLRISPPAQIINIASIAGKEGNAGISAYSAAKAGVIAFTKALSKELVSEGILVHALAPAMIETSMLNEMTSAYIEEIRAKIPMGRLGLPNEVAAAVSWLCSRDCSFTTGAVMDLSGGRATY